MLWQDNFGNLDKYKEEAANDIREYMVQSREEIILLFNRDGSYYDTYVSRPYIIYKDKEYAKEIFRLFKKVWQDREVLLIEGRTARIGIGNDLFQGQKESAGSSARRKMRGISMKKFCR